MTSPRDIERISEKISQGLGIKYDIIKPQVSNVLSGRFKQLANYIERPISGENANESTIRKHYNAIKIADKTLRANGGDAASLQRPARNSESDSRSEIQQRGISGVSGLAAGTDEQTAARLSKPVQENEDSLYDDLDTLAAAYARLKTADEKTEFNARLLHKTKFKVAGNAILLNPEGMELVRQAHAFAFGRDAAQEQGFFYGAYQNADYTERVLNALKYGALGGRMDYETRQKANDLIKAFETAQKASPRGDTRIIATNKDNPTGLVRAQQEELSHQIDSRNGDISAKVIPQIKEGVEMMDALDAPDSGYQGSTRPTLAREVGAKTWLENEYATAELKTTVEKLNKVRTATIAALVDAGVDFEKIKDDYSVISESAKEHIKDYERNNQTSSRSTVEGNSGQTESAGTQPSDMVRTGGTALRERNNSESPLDIRQKPVDNGSGVLEGTGSGTQGIKLGRSNSYESARDLVDLGDKSLYKEAADTPFRVTEDGVEVAPVHMEIIRRLEKQGLIDGAQYNPQEATNLYQQLHDLSLDHTGKERTFLQTFAKDILQTAARDGSVAVSTPERMTHEVTHQASELGAGGAPLAERVDITEGEKRRDFQIAKPFLRGLGYSKDPAELLEEMFTHIAEEKYVNIGLTKKEAISYMKWWYNSYKAQGHNLFHPKFDRAVINNPEIRKVLENERKRKNISLHPTTDAGTGTGGAQRESNTGSSQGLRREGSGSGTGRTLGEKPGGITESKQNTNENTELEKTDGNSPLYARSTLVRKSLDKLDEALSDPKNFSKVGAIEGVINKNLQELRAADEDAYTELLKLAGSQAEAMAVAVGNNVQRDDALIHAIKDRFACQKRRFVGRYSRTIRKRF